MFIILPGSWALWIATVSFCAVSVFIPPLFLQSALINVLPFDYRLALSVGLQSVILPILLSVLYRKLLFSGSKLAKYYYVYLAIYFLSAILAAGFLLLSETPLHLLLGLCAVLAPVAMFSWSLYCRRTLANRSAAEAGRQPDARDKRLASARLFNEKKKAALRSS